MRNLALIASTEIFQEGTGRESNVILLQVAPTFLRLGNIEYFINQDKLWEANHVLNFVHNHFYPDVKLDKDFYSHCQEDDDDDEEDDDEFCYRTGSDKLVTAIGSKFWFNTLPLAYKAYQMAFLSTGTFAIDGTYLELYGARNIKTFFFTFVIVYLNFDK